MVLRPLSVADCEQARTWRNDALVSLRTPFPLTAETQADFYRTVICDRRSPHRYWGAYDEGVTDRLLAMTGLTDIQWENGLAEISLIVAPFARGRGCGAKAVALVLDEAFARMRLETVFGECYYCNPAIAFWQRIANRYRAETARLPRRKYWNGQFVDAFYFSISRAQWGATQETHDADAHAVPAA